MDNLYTKIHFYRVQQGSYRRWFKGRDAAKQFCDDRFDMEFDGVPFIDEYTLEEMLLKINELEARVAGEDSLKHAPA